MPRFDNLSPGELEEIRRFIEESDIDVIDDEMRALVEKHRPELLSNLPPQTTIGCSAVQGGGKRRSVTWKASLAVLRLRPLSYRALLWRL
jgi:hypothetical protein